MKTMLPTRLNGSNLRNTPISTASNHLNIIPHHAPSPLLSAPTPLVKDIVSKIAAIVASSALLISQTISLIAPPAAHAQQTMSQIGEFATSGFVFKDTVQVASLEDPDIDNVVVYITDYKRSITERLSNDPLGDPSQASLTCVSLGGGRIKPGSNLGGKEGKEIFAERKTLNLFQNKTLRVKRMVDTKANNVIYIAYSTRLTSSADEGGVSTSRYRTSICAVPLEASSAPSLLLQ
jgi:catabolite regulation protein CreA